MKNSRKEQNNCRNTAQNDNMFVYTTIAKYIFDKPLQKHEKVWNFTPTQEPAANSMIKTVLEASLCVLQR